jgi:hypothetical protein
MLLALPIADSFIAHRNANKSMSTIPPTPGQKSIVRPVSCKFGGYKFSIGSVSVKLCTSKPRIMMLRMPMRMLRAWIVIIVNGSGMLHVSIVRLTMTVKRSLSAHAMPYMLLSSKWQ